ncbi:uncharacterized protein KY384_000403 [Bacidia gigantensis]|uniref:uncharacterized protein n=1 Tax=Bacidia gigantensis TaxID=2732470 RepID=UPI001D0435E6|nr:uncharacterized protein KY384_000403 [Bacidia gigantensis]KAG8525643.1 hypothetical protein KY384_000403 [Bacidia gigantensis]
MGYLLITLLLASNLRSYFCFGSLGDEQGSTNLLSNVTASTSLNLPAVFGDFDIKYGDFQPHQLDGLQTISIYLKIAFDIAVANTPEKPFGQGDWEDQLIHVRMRAIEPQFTHRAALAVMWYASHLISTVSYFQTCIISVEENGSSIGGIVVRSIDTYSTAGNATLASGDRDSAFNSTQRSPSDGLPQAVSMDERLGADTFKVAIKYHTHDPVSSLRLLFSMISFIGQVGLHNLEEETQIIFIYDDEAGYGIQFRKRREPEQPMLKYRWILMALRQIAELLEQDRVWTEWDGYLVLNNKVVGFMVFTKFPGPEQKFLIPSRENTTIVSNNAVL